MDTGEHRLKKNIRQSLLAVGIFSLVYLLSYVLNSSFGGYWLVPEMDGRHRWSFGLAMMDAFMWQPRFGHESVGHLDYLGALYKPLIHLDRKYVHRTFYVSDDDIEKKSSNLKVSHVHPHWRDEFLTHVTAVAGRNRDQQTIRCTLHYTGSDRPRAISEVWIPRELAKALEVSPPVGFTEKGFENSQKYQREHYIRWVGKLILPKDQAVTLAIPAKEPQAGAGRIRFYYERTDVVSKDYRNFCSVELK